MFIEYLKDNNHRAWLKNPLKKLSASHMTLAANSGNNKCALSYDCRWPLAYLLGVLRKLVRSGHNHRDDQACFGRLCDAVTR